MRHEPFGHSVETKEEPRGYPCHNTHPVAGNIVCNSVFCLSASYGVIGAFLSCSSCSNPLCLYVEQADKAIKNDLIYFAFCLI
ncbi:hypothetical protein ADJ77_01150 [Prevotella fusca JCM 17724]|uniref:Uncharacterized protein n=1 Tax=Prevotella fusca JCM 17724 TaxID=1236517 RepID=A0A0K1NI12_9BACT|nr:hypothetical protein ADJ77_01150 [Prevotella fusca JCM 17724]